MWKYQKIAGLGRRYRRIKRYRQIISILVKYGWSDFFDWVKGSPVMEMEQGMTPDPSLESVTRAVRLRLAFTELGSTFIKLAQLLSARPDVVSPAIAKELAKLQDKVPPFPYDQVQEIFEREFGAPPEDLFRQFDPVPIASASIGQVHQAWLEDGRKVAIKVQRPNLKKIIETDVEIMMSLASLMERSSPNVVQYEPTKIVKEFSRSISKEVDYSREASNMLQFQRLFEGNKKIHIPEVYSELSSPVVLTMEFVDGIKISHLEELANAGLDSVEVNDLCADFFLEQVFEVGVFHADPHPGNVFVLPGPGICMLDFGIVGMLDRQTRETFIDLLESIVQQNPRKVVGAVLALTQWEEQPNRKNLELDIQDFIMTYLNKPLKDIHVGAVFQDLLYILSHHRLRLPSNFFMMLRAFGIAEGVSLMLDPDFNMMAKMLPFIKRVRLDRLTPQRLASDFMEIAGDVDHLVRQFPKDVMDITHMIRNHQLRLQIDHVKTDELIDVAGQTGNRIAAGIVLAGMIIASTILLALQVPPLFQGNSILGLITFLTSIMLGFGLLRRIFKKQNW